jgi:cytoskeletal protein CcmA (bactofilin family)
MKSRIAALTGLVLCLNLGLSAMVIHNDAELKENGVRTERGVFGEDYLYLGHELRFSGQAEDLVFLGKELAFSGTTKLGLFAIGKNVMYSGKSGNGVMAGCMDLSVDGVITGNSYVGCKSFHLADTASINGNLFIACAKLRIDGALKGNLYAAAGEIVINDTIKGDVTAYGGRVIIGDKGRINGNLTYSSKERLSDQELARVTGAIVVDEKHAFGGHREFPKAKAAMKTVGAIIGLALFVSFVVVGCLLLLVPVFRRLEEKLPERTFWSTALRGLVPLLMYPAAVVLCVVMVVTIPFAFVLLLAALPLLFVAHVIGSTLAGQYLVTKLKWNVQKRHYHFLIGALAGAILSAIPVIGCLAFILISSLGFGVYLSFVLSKQSPVAQQ